MTTLDRRTFLAAILANPSDDGPRLVFADWLEDVGECDRAEFVRVQVELAKHPCGDEARRKFLGDRCSCEAAEPGFHCGPCLDLARREIALRRLEHALLVDLWSRGELTRGLPGVNYHSYSRDGQPIWAMSVQGSLVELGFRRGFVAAVRLRWEVWVGRTCHTCYGNPVPTVQEVSGNGDPEYLYHTRCPICRGTHWLPGLGPLLVRRCPLDRDAGVRFTDREPHDAGNGQYSWSLERGLGVSSGLPDVLFDLLEEVQVMRAAKRRGLPRYPSPDLAHAALSRSAIAWALAQPAEVMTRG